MRVLDPCGRVSLDHKDGYSILRLSSELLQDAEAQSIDEFMPILLIDLARHYLGSKEMPVWIELPSRSMKDKTSLEAIHGVPIRFRQGAAGIAMAQLEPESRNPSKVPVEREVLDGDLPRLLGVSLPCSLADRVVETLWIQIVLGDISIETVANCLSQGVQALQRRLRTEGTSYRELRTEFLKTRAIDLLSQTDHSVEAIAGALGYTETNSFRRAFRSWTGLTPTRFVGTRSS